MKQEPENVKDACAARVTKLCMERTISYNELANRCGITPSTIYSIMDKTRHDISLVTVKRLCDGLEITLEEFFSSPLFDSLPPGSEDR